MKKTLLAAALMGAAAAASAQSNVTIYGRVDVGVTRQNDGTSFLAGGNGQTGPAGDRYDVRQGSSSRLGFRITEDLGGGLTAGAVLEHRFTADDGATNTPFWTGRSIVELGSKSFGTVYLGRDYIPVYYIADAADPFSGETVGRIRDDFLLNGNQGVTGAGYRVDGDVRSNNTVGFRTISFSGFSAQVAVSAGEGSRTTPLNKRTVGANVRYASGPIYIGAGFDQADSNNNLWVVSAAYDFGFVRPMLAYSQSEVRGTAAVTRESTTFSVGATAPVGPGRLKAVFARQTRDRFTAANLERDLDKYALGYEYNFSKRTSLYVDVGSAKRDDLTRTTAVDLGVKHNF
jgi:predicted porin